jgi:hypothetical protein
MAEKTNPNDAAFATSDNGTEYHTTWQGQVGLTKREYFAASVSFESNDFQFKDFESLKSFVGRSSDNVSAEEMIRIGAEAEAKIRVMKADALIEELNK